MRARACVYVCLLTKIVSQQLREHVQLGKDHVLYFILYYIHVLYFIFSFWFAESYIGVLLSVAILTNKRGDALHPGVLGSTASHASG